MSEDHTDSSAASNLSHDVEIKHGEVLPPSNNAVAQADPVAPARIAATRGRSRWRALALLGIVIIGTGGGFAYSAASAPGGSPLGDRLGQRPDRGGEIDIDTKFAGRIAEMLADQGDMVKAGQVVARMDTQGPRSLAQEVRGSGRAGAASLEEAAPMSSSRRLRSRCPAGVRPHHHACRARLRHQRTAGPAPQP